MLDASALQSLLCTEQQDTFFQAHVSLNRLTGAGAWLTAPPTEDGREMAAELFRIAVKRRLRVPVFDEDAFCPCGGDPLDRWGDHAIMCPCGGDRTKQHNHL